MATKMSGWPRFYTLTKRKFEYSANMAKKFKQNFNFLQTHNHATRLIFPS